MTALDEELGMKVEMEKHEEGTKTSSIMTIRRGSDVEMDKETAVATSQPKLTDSTTEDGDEAVGGDGDGDGDGGNGLKDKADEDGLPLSRARSIALVATVTGAAFLNVSDRNPYKDNIPPPQLHANNTPTAPSKKHSSLYSISLSLCVGKTTNQSLSPIKQTLAVQSVVIILPTIGNHLSVPESRQQWIVSSYSLTFGCFLLFWGRIADLYGKRLVFILGSIWVTAVTAANPFVPNEIAFNLFRGLHGLVSVSVFASYLHLLCCVNEC
jgi:hypothetical protein